MKKYTLIFAILLFSTTFFSSCEKLKSLADIEFDADFESQLDVAIQPTALKSTLGAFNQAVTIDPLSNAEFQKYKDKIKDIHINSAEITITQLSPSPINLTTATLTASATNFQPASWTVNNETLTVGKVITLDNNQQQFNKLKAIINQKNPFEVRLQGSTNVDQGNFKAKIKFKTRVTANPLN